MIWSQGNNANCPLKATEKRKTTKSKWLDTLLLLPCSNLPLLPFSMHFYPKQPTLATVAKLVLSGSPVAEFEPAIF